MKTLLNEKVEKGKFYIYIANNNYEDKGVIYFDKIDTKKRETITYVCTFDLISKGYRLPHREYDSSVYLEYENFIASNIVDLKTIATFKACKEKIESILLFKEKVKKCKNTIAMSYDYIYINRTDYKDSTIYDPHDNDKYMFGYLSSYELRLPEEHEVLYYLEYDVTRGLILEKDNLISIWDRNEEK